MAHRSGKSHGWPLGLQSACALVLATLADEPENLERFLALSGLAVHDLRASTRDPAFLRGVIDYARGDEALLCQVAARAAMTPEAMGQALARFSEPQAEVHEERDVWIDP